jgi:hypothetical protein
MRRALLETDRLTREAPLPLVRIYFREGESFVFMSLLRFLLQPDTLH